MTRDTRRRMLSHLVIVLCAMAVLIAMVPLALVLFHVVRQGISSVSAAFFTEMPRPVGERGGPGGRARRRRGRGRRRTQQHDA